MLPGCLLTPQRDLLASVIKVAERRLKRVPYPICCFWRSYDWWIPESLDSSHHFLLWDPFIVWNVGENLASAWMGVGYTWLRRQSGCVRSWQVRASLMVAAQKALFCWSFVSLSTLGLSWGEARQAVREEISSRVPHFTNCSLSSFSNPSLFQMTTLMRHMVWMYSLSLMRR